MNEQKQFVLDKLFAAPKELAHRCHKSDNEEQMFRSKFMRDRDRILYSRAFRRLSGKTQIYLTGADDHYRNRLTHTLEVSQIASTITQALGLDRDLTEAIALGHDIGHTPFGHAGEQILHKLMTPKGKDLLKESPYADIEQEQFNDCLGFKHNLQSIRLAIKLENIYDDEGLNLTNFTLWGIHKHSSGEYKTGEYKKANIYDRYTKCYNLATISDKIQLAWSFEAFVVAEADEIAQLHHDLEDAIRGRAMSKEDVLKIIRKYLLDLMSTEDIKRFNNMSKKNIDNESFIVSLSRVVVNTLVTTIIQTSISNLEKLRLKYGLNKENIIEFFKNSNPENVEISKTISYDDLENVNKISRKLDNYTKQISTKVHNSLVVQRMNTKGQYIIRKLFQAYYSHPEQLPNHSLIQFLIDVGEYKTKVRATSELIKKGEGAMRTKFMLFFNSTKYYGQKEKIELMRVICDHIAGMTDKYAIEEFEKLYN